MFARLRRGRLRACLSPLINGELSPDETARALEQITADAVLATELAHLQGVVQSLRGLPDAGLPQHFRSDLAVALDCAAKPLRDQYLALLEGELAAAEDGALRAAIAADAELRGELAWVETVVGAVRALPEAPLPAGFREALDRRLDALQPQRRTYFPRLLLPAAAVAAVLIAAFLGFGHGRDGLPSAPAPAVATAPLPAPVERAAAVPVAPAPAPAAPSGVKPAPKPAPVKVAVSPRAERRVLPSRHRIRHRSRPAEPRPEPKAGDLGALVRAEATKPAGRARTASAAVAGDTGAAGHRAAMVVHLLSRNTPTEAERQSLIPDPGDLNAFAPGPATLDLHAPPPPDDEPLL
ncbi:MAG: hypothetical protein HYU66_16860 [Armatimonadetes bacterium]|nr:hypothetical protein [Armatimonadota bacterium]